MDVDRKALVHERNAREWRAWLRRNHRKAGEAWLVFHQKATKRAGITYNDAVDEALCWGWIDSVVKGIGNGSRAQRFTPRRAGSPVSEMNRARVRRMVKARRMTKAGLANLPGVDEWLDPPPLRIPADVRRELAKDPEAARHFEAFPEAYLRIRIGWIAEARDPTERRKRLAHFLRMTSKGQRYGMVQE